ncbi:MAG: SDR family oxidoreductase [Myxococcota bacterium]
MNQRLEKKVALITGGSKGLGLAIAKVFAREGASLFLVARNTADLDLAAKALTEAGAEVATLAIDVSAPHATERAADACSKRFGHIDILVNGAGFFLWRKFTEVSLDDWQRVVTTNLTAPFCMAQSVARRMEKDGQGGCIINIASIHGSVADGNVVPQCATKLGVVGMTRAMAEALRGVGVRVNSISPGAIDPDSGEDLSEGLQSKITQRDIAEMALYPASDAARGVSGANFEAHGITRAVVASK